ncbi:two-component sensor histidine kinase [Desulfoluna limicola]|uniref:histidine kinase n=1 Tax=Desulfoluna limicola TaxID=2810562 RepID=A0ABM7PDT8_9BACT|nr:ATP-binding protein [Desulfoluna limicola]BCS95253.1 two-component sensor histidine kinase [Desulfoluna limicola]
MKIKIKHKLFFTLLLTSGIIATGMFLFLQWSFDRGFLNYVNSQELSKLDQLTERLKKNYAIHGDWAFMIDNHRLWQQMHRGIMGTNEEPPRHRPRPGRNEADFRLPPPPQGTPDSFEHRAVLFDADKRQIIGGPHFIEANLKLRPISYQETVIGYLGMIPAKALSDAGDLLFVEEQMESFAIIACVMAVLSLLLSFPVASHLLRPVNELTRGTRKLMAGEFKTRIPITTEDELGQLSSDFNSLAMTLEKNEQSRQQWVADISHELRTPLSILRGEVEALQDGIRQLTPEALQGLHCEMMHLGRLIEDLYELSMSDVGALDYRKIPVDPIGVIEETIELLTHRFAKKGLKLAVHLPEGQPVSMLADPDRLQQLFTNILENSLRYTDSPGELEILMTTTKHKLVIRFQDSAPGVPPEHLPKLFDRLFRVEKSRGRAKGGAGLGLAICSNIAEAHQGAIKAAPSPSGGLEIRIELPLST